MTNLGSGDSFIERPRVVLFVKKHWRYLQRQYHLSPRELEVAKLICEGYDNQEIATHLKMKLGTVKTHIRNIYRNIRVGSKIEMLLKFVDSLNKLSTAKAISLPIPIVSIEKPQKKISSPFHASENKKV
jgi:DNA-binding CsgD family transcriptional regulator